MARIVACATDACVGYPRRSGAVLRPCPGVGDGERSTRVAGEQGPVHGADVATFEPGHSGHRGHARLRRPARRQGQAQEPGRWTGRSGSWPRGYAVLFADSFTARGVREICTVDELVRSSPRTAPTTSRQPPSGSASQPYIDKSRLALMGWSHGAMAVLWAVRPGFLERRPGSRRRSLLSGLPPDRPARGLAPECSPDPADRRRPTTGPGLGPAGSSRDARASASSSTSAPITASTRPTSRVRVRRGLGAVEGGHAHVGTDAAARDAAIKEVMDTLRTALGGP